jgi:hypothetical protein
MDANFEHLVSVDDDLTSRVVSLENTTVNLTAPSPQLTYDGSTGELTYTQGDTDTVVEGTTNLYYTDDRVGTYLTVNNYATQTWVSNEITALTGMVTGQSTSDGITEGTTNLYFTDDRARSAISVSGDLTYDSATGVIGYTPDLTNYYTKTEVDAEITTRITDVASGNITLTGYATESYVDNAILGKDNTDEITEGTTNLYYTTARANTDFDTALATKSTNDLAEGTNLYYTDDRVDTYLTTNNYATKLFVTTNVQNAIFGASFATVATSGDYTDLTNTPNFATVATSGDYTDLTNTPTTVSTFTNDSNYITLTDLSVSGDLAYDNTTGVISYTQPTNISTFTNDSAYLVDADIRSEFTAITNRLDTLEAPTYTIFDVFRNQYDNNTGGYTVSDESIYFYIRALDTFRLNWLASGQTDPSWDSLVDDIESSDVAGIEASFSSMAILDQTVFLLPMVFLLNAQIKIINEALGKSYTNLTFDILSNSFSSWESTNSGFETDAATFEGSLNTTNTSFITGLLKNNSYDDFTADRVVTGWNPV